MSVPNYPLHEFLLSKKGQLGRRYNKAVGQLIKQGYDAKRNSAITMFVKKEKYYDSTKSPRMIMGRDPRFNILYGPIVSLLEKAFFELPQVCNACDFKECGSKFTKLWAHTHLIYENDMSKYEATQTFELLKIEYLVNYNAMLLANFPKDMLNAYTTCFATKIVKVCHSVTGISCKFECCRGSGDMDTSLGNGEINLVTSTYNQCMNYCPRRENCLMDGSCCSCYEDIMLKGDDSVLGAHNDKIMENYYADFGLEAKLIRRDIPSEVEFCSGNFLEYSPGNYFYVQKLRKLLTGLQYCINDDFIKNGHLGHYYKSLGDMYSVLYAGIPIYSDIGALLRTSHNRAIQTDLLKNNSYGAFDAFVNHKSVYQLDVEPTTLMVSLSQTSGFSFAELSLIKEWAINSTLLFPPEHMKPYVSKRIKCIDLNDSRMLDRINLREGMTTKMIHYEKLLQSAQAHYSVYQ